MTPLRGWVLVLLGAGCSTEVPPSNPFDLATPPAKQQAARLTGHVTLVAASTSADGLPFVLLDAAGVPVQGVDGAVRTALARALEGDGTAAGLGQFEFSGLAPGTYGVAPGPDDRFSAFLAPGRPQVTLLPGETRAIPDQIFTRLDTGSCRVSGEVVLRQSSGGPREVTLYRLVGQSMEVRAQQRTASDGTFDLRGLPPGVYALSAEHAGFTSDYRVGFELTEPAPGGLSSEREFKGEDALTLHSATAVLVPNVQRSFGTYYTRERTLPVLVLAFGGMTHMRLATHPTFTSGLEGDHDEAEYVPYRSVADVLLPESEGPLLVYAQFRNQSREGFEFTSDVHAAQVVRDATPPVVLRLSARGLGADADGRVWVRDAARPVTVEIQGTDRQSAVAGYAVHLDADNSPGIPELLSFTAIDAPGGAMTAEETLALTAGDGEKTIWVYLRDRPGNTSEPVGLSLRVDSRPPIVAPLVVENALAGAVLNQQVATVRLEVPGVCGGGEEGDADDCPVGMRLGAQPLDGAGLLVPLPSTGWTLAESDDGHEVARRTVPVAFGGENGQVVAFEGVFQDAAGNVAHATSTNYTLRLRGLVQGRVLVEGFADAEPRHGGVTVALWRMGEDPATADPTATATTAPDGAFGLTDVPSGRYLVRATRAGAVTLESTAEVRPNQTTDTGTLRLATARGLLTGRFVRSDKRGLPTGNGGIAVSVRLNGSRVADLQTGDDGTFVVAAPGLPVTTGAEAYTVSASAQGYVGRVLEGAAVVQGETTVLNADPSDPTRPLAYELAQLTGDFDVCAATGPCQPEVYTNRTAHRVKLRSTANVTGIRARARQAWTSADATPFVPFTEGLLPAVDLAGADGLVPIYVEVKVSDTVLSLQSHIVLDTVAPRVTSLSVAKGRGAVLEGFTREPIVQATVTADVGGESGVAPLEASRLGSVAGAVPDVVPSTASSCGFGSACPVALPVAASGSPVEGAYRVFAFACDQAGNCGAGAAPVDLVYDTTGPKVAHGVAWALTSPSIHVAHGTTFTRSTAFDLALGVGTAKTSAGAPVLQGTAPVPDVAAWRTGTKQPDGAVVYGDWIVLAPVPTAAATRRVTPPPLPAIDDDYVTYLQLRDAAGNDTTAGDEAMSYALTLDTTPPLVAFALQGGAAWTTDPRVTLGFTFAPGDRGPAEKVWLSTDGGLFGTYDAKDLPLATPSLDLPASAPPQGDGRYVVYARFIDAAGNTADRSDDVFLDRTKPEILAARCGNCLTDASGRLWSRRPELTLYLTAADNSGQVSDTRYRIGTGAQASGAYAGTLSPVLPDTDAAHDLTISVTDPAGNASLPSLLTVRLDRVPPEFALQLAGGGDTTTSLVPVKVTATNPADFASMQIGTDPTFTGAPATAFVPSFAWTVPAPETDGDKTLYVKVVDFAGNETVRSGTVRLRTRGAIQGTATYPGGAPADGVAVALSGSAAADGSVVSASATTDASGRYAFTTLPPGTYTLTFTRAGYEPLRLPTLTLNPGASIQAPATLVRAVGGLFGKVTPVANGTPIVPGAADFAGIGVSVTGPGLQAPYTTVTDTGGRWSLAALPVPLTGAYTLTASKPGFDAATTPVASMTAGQLNPVVDLSLPISAFTVSGRVTVEGGDHGAVTATLTGTAFNGAAPTPAPVATSAANGTFSFSSIPAGTYTVTLHKTAYFLDQELSPVVVAPGAVPTLTAALTRAMGTLRGTVSVQDGGTGLDVSGADNLANVAVVVSDPSLPASLGAVTDASGAFSIAGIPVSYAAVPQAYVVKATKAGFGQVQAGGVPVVVLPGPAATSAGTVAVAALGSRITGCVQVAAPGDLSGVSLGLSGAAFNGSAWAKASAGQTLTQGACASGLGAFSITGVPNGTYALTVARASFEPVTVGAITVAGADRALAATVTLGRSRATVSGTVAVSAAPTAIAIGAAERAGVLVTAVDSETGASLSTTTDANGAFVLAGVPWNVASGGRYTLTASKPSFLALPASVTTPVSSASVSVNGLALQVNAGSLTVDARLYDDGATGAGRAASPTPVTVFLTGNAFNGAAINTSLATNGSGLAVFSNLPAGTWSASAGYAGYTSASVVGVALAAGATATSTLKLLDVTAPTAPGLASSRRSPTTAVTTDLTIVQASTDATANFVPTGASPRGSYQVRACSPSCTTTSWTGAAALPVSLGASVDTNLEIRAVDGAGNQSAATTLVLRSERSVPGPVKNLRVDNRPGAVLLSWDPGDPVGSLPVAGYRVYYGPFSSTALEDYAGTNAVQGASPIDVGGATQALLSGLTDGATYWAAVIPYDTAVDPGPNLGALVDEATARLAPSGVPFDFAARELMTPAYELAAWRNQIFVSVREGSGYRIDARTYSAYGSAPRTSFLVSPRAASLAVDASGYLYAFGSGTGVDVIATHDPSALAFVPPQSPATTFLPGLEVDHLVPAHWSDEGTSGRTHGVFSYKDAVGTYRIGTFSHDPADRRRIVADGVSTPIVRGTRPLAMAVNGRQVYVYSYVVNGSGYQYYLDAYNLSADLSTITSNGTNCSAGQCSDLGWSYGTGTGFAFDFPYFYMPCGGFAQALCAGWITGVAAAGSSTIGPVSVVPGVQLAFGNFDAPWKLLIVGDQLLVSRASGPRRIQALSLANRERPAPSGGYDMRQEQQGPTVALAASGPHVYALTTSEYLSRTALDVVELGSPRSARQVGSYLSAGHATVGPVRVRGTHAIGIETDTLHSTSVTDVTLHTALQAPVVTHLTSQADMPPAFDIDESYGYFGNIYAPMLCSVAVVPFKGITPPVLGCTTVDQTPTAITAAGDRVLALVDSDTTYLNVLDVSRRSVPVKLAFVPGPGRSHGRVADVQGRYAFVGLVGGLCVVDLLPNPPVELACQTRLDGATFTVTGVRADGRQILASTDRGTVLFTWDPTTPTTPPVATSMRITSRLGTPWGLTRYGPYAMQGVPGGIAAFDLSRAQAPVVGYLSEVSGASFDTAGPLLLAPGAGFMLLRMY